MFIGHYAVALATKRAAPRTSLGTLFAAASLADLLWVVFLLAGWEQATIVGGPEHLLTISLDHFPLSHGLLALTLWALLFAALHRARTGYVAGTIAVAACVLSHWVLDFVTHRPDMQLYPGGARLGLGLYHSAPGTVAVETAMFVAGAWVYATATRARDAVGRWAVWTLLAALALPYVAGLLAGPPTSWLDQPRLRGSGRQRSRLRTVNATPTIVQANRSRSTPIMDHPRRASRSGAPEPRISVGSSGARRLPYRSRESRRRHHGSGLCSARNLVTVSAMRPDGAVVLVRATGCPPIHRGRESRRCARHGDHGSDEDGRPEPRASDRECPPHREHVRTAGHAISSKEAANLPETRDAWISSRAPARLTSV